MMSVDRFAHSDSRAQTSAKFFLACSLQPLQLTGMVEVRIKK
jgi:hypothetical protein